MKLIMVRYNNQNKEGCFMNNLAIIGLQWGDEGKGKIVDLLAERYDIIARFQGGHNAGHTVYLDGKKVVLHLIPSGIFWKHTTCVIGNGVVIDLRALKKEMDELESIGIRLEHKLLISKKAHLIFPYHLLFEQKMEEALGSHKIGTTLKGIGPAYEDKFGRRGILISDIENIQTIKDKLNLALDFYAHYIDINKERLLEDIINEIIHFRPFILPYLCDVPMYLMDKMDVGESILFEGAQGTMLDIDHGTYPFITCSNTTAGGICTGLGISPNKIHKVLGISKAYTTRVGAGVFPSEILSSEADIIREKGNEYGSTTGRPRRCGWLDLVALKYACKINGCDSIAITKLDVLDIFDSIKLCIAYQYKGEIITDFPSENWILQDCKPIYREMPGWKENTHSLTDKDKIPEKAKDYLRAIEDFIECEISILSTGPQRQETIFLKAID